MYTVYIFFKGEYFPYEQTVKADNEAKAENMVLDSLTGTQRDAVNSYWAEKTTEE